MRENSGQWAVVSRQPVACGRLRRPSCMLMEQVCAYGWKLSAKLARRRIDVESRGWRAVSGQRYLTVAADLARPRSGVMSYSLRQNQVRQFDGAIIGGQPT